MGNRFYTVLIVPEKTSQVRRIILPSWVLRGTAIGLAFVTLIAAVMIFDYWYVMNQISENKTLRMENRRLRQQVQVFKNKMVTVEKHDRSREDIYHQAQRNYGRSRQRRRDASFAQQAPSQGERESRNGSRFCHYSLDYRCGCDSCWT